jgi:SAM-dependent methyltransferase
MKSLTKKDYSYYRKKIEEFWDKNAYERAHDIEDGNDKNYIERIAPRVILMIQKWGFDANIKILDIGCGTGYLTNKVSKLHSDIIGIDISGESIVIAHNKFNKIRFFHKDIYELDAIEEYDLCLSIMVAHNLPYLPEFFRKVYSALKCNGYLLLTTLHPAFWPQERIKGFIYTENEKEYEVPLRGRSSRKYVSRLSYFHRTIEAYLNVEGFQLLDFEEICGYENDSEERKLRNEPNIITILLQKIDAE